MGFSELVQRFQGSQGKPCDMKTQGDVGDPTECSVTGKLDSWQESGMKGIRRHFYKVLGTDFYEWYVTHSMVNLVTLHVMDLDTDGEV